MKYRPPPVHRPAVMDARREAGREAGSGEEQRLPARTRALTAGGGRSTKHRAATSAPRMRAGHAARPVHLHRGAHGEAEGGGTWRSCGVADVGRRRRKRTALGGGAVAVAGASRSAAANSTR